MFLAIDVGNTQTTLGLYDSEGTGLVGWRMATNAADTSDMLHACLYAYFVKDGLNLRDVEEAALACVVPVLARAWSKCLEALLGHEPLVITAACDCGIELDIPEPTRLGADRIANAVAARDSYGAPVIVVDFGTATNIDVVDEKGAYRGGTIGPGLMLSANALFSRAAKISSVPIEVPPHTLGDTTQTAVQSGLVIGAAVQAEGLVKRIKDELGIHNAKVIGTGGLAHTVSAATTLFDEIDPDLTMRGIRTIALGLLAEG